MNGHQEEFVKILEKINPSKSTHEVFSDWLVMASAALYSFKKDASVEKQYADTAAGYTKEDLDGHSHLIAVLVEALERKKQDFLGEVFAQANLTNERNGQFFTPYNISLMSAQLILDKNDLPQDRLCRINDPTCGSGGMLVAATEVLEDHGFDYQKNAFFTGQDIDARCARMAFIQLSLLGVPAVIYCMNSLTQEEYWHRETIGYHLAGMEFRLRAERLRDRTESLGQAESQRKLEALPEPARQAVKTAQLQGELF